LKILTAQLKRINASSLAAKAVRRAGNECRVGAKHSRTIPRAKVVLFQTMGGVRKKNNRQKLDDRTYDEFPERPQIAVPDWNSDKLLWNVGIGSIRGKK